MKKKLIAAVAALATAVSYIPVINSAPVLAAVEPGYEMRAFPTAEGGGMFVTGARGAESMEVYHVTNLNDSGEGSFRDAVSKSNRIIVFDVSGMIDLDRIVSISGSNLTILGQTAPGDGICFRGNSVKINGSNIILRYLRFRVGSKLKDGSNTATQDGFGIPIGAKDIIMDHCSISWGTDENLSIIGTENVTVQWSIISEALNSSIHAKGEHSYAGIWGGVNSSFHHNIIASHKSRNPKIGTSETVSMTPGYTDKETTVDMWNNVIYNWGDKAGYGAENGANVNIVNNYYKAGPATPSGKRARIFELSPGNKYQPKWSGDIYANGNYIDDDSDTSVDVENAEAVNSDNWQIERKTGVYLDEKGVQTYNKLDEAGRNSYLNKDNLSFVSYMYGKEIQTAQEAYESVLDGAGARMPKMDLVDSRIIEDVTNRTAPETGTHGSSYLLDDPVDGIPEGQESLYDDRGYPIWQSETRSADFDTDGDGIPDTWEDKMGLDKTNPLDSLNLGPDRYTWLEIYGESLISDNTTDEEISVTDNGDGEYTLTVNDASAEITSFYNDDFILKSDFGGAKKGQISGAENGDTIIAASYEDNRLTDIKSEVYSDNFSVPEVSGGNTRIYVWDSLGGMKPVKKAYTSIAESFAGGMSTVSAKLTYPDGTYKITPVKLLSIPREIPEPQSVSGDFEIIANISNISNYVKNVYSGIYADDFVVTAGYNEQFKPVIKYGKKSNSELSEKDNKGYNYVKITVKNGHADLYAAKTIGIWDKLSENGYDYKGTDPTAGEYLYNPDNKEYAPNSIWHKIVTDFKEPELTISNIADNSVIGFNDKVNVTINSEDNPRYVVVLFNGNVIASKMADYPFTFDIPISFDKAQEGTLTVLCYNDNLQSNVQSFKVYVSADASPWQVTDISADGNQGRAYMYAAEDYTFKIGGMDGNIGGTSDECGYVYQKFTGDSRMYYRSRMQSGKQFGIMLRKSLDADSEAYFFGGENNGDISYSLKSRDTKGADMVSAETDGLSGLNLYFIAEKAGNTLNIYQTENTSETVYTTKELLKSIDVSALGDEYYMGFASVSDGTGDPPDCGWIGFDNSADQSYKWTFDNGLDWCWQMQEGNVLRPVWTNEEINGYTGSKMLIAPDDNYTSERYIFREYIMDDQYSPQMKADIMLTGEEPAMNVYLQTGDSSTAYKLTFDSDNRIKDAVGNEIGVWEKDNSYTVTMNAGIDTETMENKCSVSVVNNTMPDELIAEADIPNDDNFRPQNNVSKTKTPVKKAVYFEPIASADGKYYIDNVSVNAVKSEFNIEKTESWYTFKGVSAISGGFTVSGMKTASGNDLSGEEISVAAGAELKTGDKSADGIKFTNRIRINNGGRGNITVPVKKGSVVTVYAASANSTATRQLFINNKQYDVLTASSFRYTYGGDDGSIEIRAGDNIEVYGISVVTKRLQTN